MTQRKVRVLTGHYAVLYDYDHIWSQYLIHSFIHSLVFSLRGRAGRNQSPVM